MDETHLDLVEITFPVRVVERGGEARGDEQRQLDAEGMILFLSALDDRLQIVAIDVLHGDVIRAADLPEVVDVNDVVVVELRGQLRFIDEHLDEFLVVREVRQDLLDRDDLLKSLFSALPRLPHFGHAAGGDLFKEHVRPETHAVSRLRFVLRRCMLGHEDRRGGSLW